MRCATGPRRTARHRCRPSGTGAQTPASSAGVLAVWNAALLAAGLDPRVVRSRDWTDEEIVTGLPRLADDLGRHLRAQDCVGSRGIYPSPALAIQRFGSWRRALLAAGLEPGNPPPTTDRRVVDALREYHRKHSCSPTTTSWKAEGGLPAAETIIRRCGSWRAAIELAELPVPQPAPRGPSDDGVIAALREYRDELDVAPTMAAWRKQHRRPGVKLIRNRFRHVGASARPGGHFAVTGL
jgi:Homing endonuclease associated repeat